jgi:hypothetical protein
MSSFQCHVARVGGASSAKEVVGISVRGRKDGTLHTGFGVCVFVHGGIRARNIKPKVCGVP